MKMFAKATAIFVPMAVDEDDKAELERIKIKLSDFQTEKTRGAIIRSRARWYEHGGKNSKYFLNLEKLN